MQTGGWGVPTQNNKQGWGGAQQQWRTQDGEQYSTQGPPRGYSTQGPSFQAMQGQPSFGGGQQMRTQSPYAQAGAGAGMRMNSNSGQQSYGPGYAPPWMQQWGQGQPSFGGEQYSTQQIGPQGQAMQGQPTTRGGRPLMPANPGVGAGPAGPRPGNPTNPPGTPEEPAFGNPTPPWGTVPTPGGGTPGQPIDPRYNPQHPMTQEQWNFYGGDRMQENLAAWIPYAQFMQNSYQYGNDFNEAMRRWDTENQWRQQSDQFNMGLAGRQQEMAEWQARTAADQWGQQFGWTQTTDQWNRDLSQQQLSQTDWYNRAQIDQARAQMESTAAIEQARMASQQQIAAMQTYGRSQAPTARWVRNW